MTERSATPQSRKLSTISGAALFARNKALLTFIIGTLVGTGSLWQWSQLQISRAKLDLDRATTLAHLGKELSSIQFAIYETTDQYSMYAALIDSLPEDELDRKLGPLATRMQLLIDDFNAQERRLASLESREPRQIRLDFRGLYRPGRPRFNK